MTPNSHQDLDVLVDFGVLFDIGVLLDVVDASTFDRDCFHDRELW